MTAHIEPTLTHSQTHHSQMLEQVTALAQAKNQQDIESSLGIYHQDAELITPSLNAHGIGAAQVRQQLELFFNVFPDYKVTLEQHAFNGNLLLATGQVTVTPTLSPAISNKPLPTVTVPVFIEFHFKDGKITKEVFHLDIEHIYKKSGLTKQSLYMNNQLFINTKKAGLHHA